MTPETDVLLDGVRTLLFRVWRAVNRKDRIPRAALEECFRSFGLWVPFNELRRICPDLTIVRHELEATESSLMVV